MFFSWTPINLISLFYVQVKVGEHYVRFHLLTRKSCLFAWDRSNAESSHSQLARHMYSSPPVSNVPLYGPLQPKSQSISPKLQGAYGTAGANRAFNYMPATSEKYFINSHKRGCVKYRLCIYITSNNVSGCHRALMNHCSYLPLNPYWYSVGPLLFRAE